MIELVQIFDRAPIAQLGSGDAMAVENKRRRGYRFRA
jgi:hypothetical protein